jgi:hypothetical protein
MGTVRETPIAFVDRRALVMMRTSAIDTDRRLARRQSKYDLFSAHTRRPFDRVCSTNR